MIQEDPMMKHEDRDEILLSYDLINRFDVGLTVFDENFIIKIMNKKAIELLELPEEITKSGCNFLDVIQYHAEQGEYGPGAVDTLVQQRVKLIVPDQTYSFIRERPNGTIIQIVGHPIASGGYATTYTDITQLEEAKRFLEDRNIELIEEIQKKNEDLEKEQRALKRENIIRDIVMENTHHGISLFDRDLKLVICNKQFSSLLDFPQKFCEAGTTIQEMLLFNAERGDYGPVERPDDLTRLVDERVALARKFEPHSFRRTLPDGRVLEVIGTPIEAGFVTTYTDVSDLVASQAAERETSNKLSDFVETSPVGVGISRIEDGKILMINLSGAKLLGFDSTEAIIGLRSSQNWTSKEQRESFVETFKKEGSVKAEEVQLCRADGERFWCYLSWNKIVHENKDRILFWIYDISEQKETQRQLFETEKLASLGGLVAGVAHEINTPIGIGVTAITHLQDELRDVDGLLAGGTLSKGGLEGFFKGTREALNIILSNLRSAAHLIHSFKQVSVDQISEEPREILISEYLSAIIESLNPKTKRSNVRVELNCVEDISILTYPGAISQIITNLISNSLIHAFPDNGHGTINISISGHPHVGIEIRFEDDGIGIPEDILPKVMDPFFTTKLGEGGSGLGLCIVHNIITQKLKGSINFKSHPGEGFMLYITIPTLNLDEGDPD